MLHTMHIWWYMVVDPTVYFCPWHKFKLMNTYTHRIIDITNILTYFNFVCKKADSQMKQSRVYFRMFQKGIAWKRVGREEFDSIS